MLDTFNFNLAQFDLGELILLPLALFNNEAQILLADFTIAIFLVHSVLVLGCAHLSIEVVDVALLVIFYFQEVLVDDVHRVWSHLLLLLLICFGELINNLLVSMLELACVFDFGI